MSRITIHLDNLTDVRLRQWCAGAADPGNPYRTVDAAEVIQAMIRLSRRDPYVRGQVSNRLRLHPGGETARNAIPVDLDNQTDLELRHWSGEADPDEAIQAMVHVLLHDRSIGDRVISRLRGPQVPGATVLDPNSEQPLRPAAPASHPRPGTPAAPEDSRLAPPQRPPSSPGGPPVRAPRGPTPF